MQSLEEKLLIAETKLKNEGITLSYAATENTVETRLNAAKLALAASMKESAAKIEEFIESATIETVVEMSSTPIRKHNGVRHNAMPISEIAKEDPLKAKLIEAFQSLGMTEKEARIAAMDDQEFAEANFQEQHGYLFQD